MVQVNDCYALAAELLVGTAKLYVRDTPGLPSHGKANIETAIRFLEEMVDLYEREVRQSMESQ